MAALVTPFLVATGTINTAARGSILYGRHGGNREESRK